MVVKKMSGKRRIILLKRKGMNFYDDVIERYLENVFSSFGWHLTYHTEDVKWKCTLKIDESEPWMTFCAPCLETLTEEKFEEITACLAENFKTVAKTGTEADAESVSKNSEVCEFGFTQDGVSAFDEPPFIRDGEPVLKRKTYPMHSEIGIEVATFQNFGGIAKGLSIEITVPKEITVNEFHLGYYKNSETCKSIYKAENAYLQTKPVILENDGRKKYSYNFKDFVIPEGVNKFSRKLFGRNKMDLYDLRTFWIRFVTDGNEANAHGFVIRAIPDMAPENYAEIVLD